MKKPKGHWWTLLQSRLVVSMLRCSLHFCNLVTYICRKQFASTATVNRLSRDQLCPSNIYNIKKSVLRHWHLPFFRKVSVSVYMTALGLSVVLRSHGILHLLLSFWWHESYHLHCLPCNWMKWSHIPQISLLQWLILREVIRFTDNFIQFLCCIAFPH